MRSWRNLGAILSVVVLGACGAESSAARGSDVGPGDVGGKVTVETAVSANSVDVGAAVTVTCTVQQDGQAIQAATDFTVGGTTAFVKNGATVSFDGEGTFTVACTVPDLGAADETPETIVVGGNRALAMETAVVPATVAAGEDATVTCTATDAAGKPVGVSAAVDVSPSEGTTVSPGGAPGIFTLKATKAGSVSVTCRTIDGSVVDGSPATLTVTAGAPAKVTATVEPATIAAAGEAKVTCAATDAFGNAVAIGFKVSATPEGLTTTTAGSGGSVTGTKAGLYDVACKPADGTAAEIVTAKLTVEAGPAVKLVLTLTPKKKNYFLSDQVKVGWTLADAYENPVPGGAVDPIQVAPVEGITAKPNDTWQFGAEGKFTFSTCVTGNGSLCASVDAICDGTAPALVITFPERGATLNGDRKVTVTGTVADATSAVGTLKINGQDVTVGEGGAFQFPIQSDQGMNLIDATVADEYGNEHRTIRSYLFSYDWYAMDSTAPANSLVPYGVKGYLDDKLFYNPDPTDTATISQLLSMVLGGLDLMKLVPNPLTSVDQIGCKYDVYLTGATFDNPTALMQTVQGGLSMNVVLANLKIDILLKKTNTGFNLCPGDTAAHATADKVNVGTVISISVDANHQLKLAAGSSTISLDNFNLKVDAWFNFLVGLFKGTIEKTLKDEFTKQIGGLVESLNGTLGKVLGQPLELPIDPLFPGMNRVVLRALLQPQTAAFETAGGALDLNVAVTSDKLVDRTVLGSIARSACLSGQPEAFALETGDPDKIQLAAFDDVLNEALYAFWNNKGLHLHVTSADLASMNVDLSSYGISNLDLVTAPLLPPVITACPADKLTVQLGDFYTEASFDFGGPVVLHMYLFLKMRADLMMVDDPEKGRVIGIQLYEPDLTEIEVVFINDEWYGQEQTFVDLIKGAIPLAFSKIKEKPITFAIPAINLQSLGGGGSGSGLNLPLPNKDLVIDVKELGHDLGYTHLSAGLLIKDPPPVTPTTP